MKYSRKEMEAMRSVNIDRWFDEWNETGKKPSWDYEEENEKIFVDWLMSLEVGDHAHVCCYSDIEPCTVIKKTAMTVTVRYDKATMNGTWKPEFDIGGFCAHCVNNDDQKNAWDIEEDPDGRVETFRFRKSVGGYRNKCDEKLYPEWAKKYDYNF